MIQPYELTLDLPMEAGNNVLSTTTQVWSVLSAAYNGDLNTIKSLVAKCPELFYAQYNYAPPIHFAVREGHKHIVQYLLENGAHDPSYKIYPFQESLQTIAMDRGYFEIAALLDAYAADPSQQKYNGDNGRIIYNHSVLQQQFEKAVYDNELKETENILQHHPGFALDKTFSWSEGILTFPVKGNHRAMIDLLMKYGATVPSILKWTQFYYFERYDAATYIMEKGMNPDTMSWQCVTILHDMAQKGDIDKAALLIQYGAGLNRVDEAYLSTPLGLAAKWGHAEMVDYLLKQGADPNTSGAEWSTPLSWALSKGFDEVATLLRNAGAK